MKKINHPIKEYISSEGQTIAIVVRSAHNVDNLEFFTQDTDPLQVGVHSKKEGTILSPHLHVGPEKVITEIQEVLYIIEGEVEVTFYTSQGKKVTSTIIKTGDLLIHQRGGHGFRMIKATKILEVKQGPYHGQAHSKKYIES